MPQGQEFALNVIDEAGQPVDHGAGGGGGAAGGRSRSNSNASQRSQRSQRSTGPGLSPDSAAAARHSGESGRRSSHGSRRGSVDSEYSASDRDKGERLPYIENPGPVANRKCRDWFWALLFLLFWAGMLAVGIYASQVGNANALLYGIDYEGNLCGIVNAKRDLSDKPNLFAFQEFNAQTLRPQSSKAVCIKECPTTLAYFGTGLEPPIGPDPATAICQYGFPQPTTAAELLTAVSNRNCSEMTFPSTSYLYRCIPVPESVTSFLTFNVTADNANTTVSTVSVNGTTYINDIINVLNARNVAVAIFRDLYNAWPYLLASAGIAAAISFLWLFVIQLLTGPVVWFSIIFVLISLLGLCAYLWYQYYLLTTDQAFFGGQLVVLTTYNLDTYVYNRTTFLVLACIVSAIFLFMFLTIIFLRKRISLAIALIKIACRALRKMPTIFLVPYFKGFLLLLATVWAVFTCIMLATAGSPTTFELNGVPYLTFSNQNLIAYLTIYVVFGYYWAWNFIIALTDTTIAGSVATWYWTRDKKKLPWLIVLPSLWRVFRYHLGSVALGSLIIALIQWIRYMLRRLEKTINKSKNPVITCIFKCLQCCFLCVERFMKFLSHYAYIEIAVYGYSFCTAAFFAFQLITRNVLRVIVIDKISNFALFSSRLIITIVTTVICNYFLLNRMESPTYWALPLVLIFFIALAISYLFVVVVSMAITTVFICFCEDSERNDGSAERPFYMVKNLRKFVDRNCKEQKD